jgi:hypothetical protein
MEDSGVTRRTVLRGTALGVIGAAALSADGALTRAAAKADTAALTLTVDTATRRPLPGGGAVRHVGAGADRRPLPAARAALGRRQRRIGAPHVRLPFAWRA